MLTIGEFSKLGHVSARMLRHYDILGLLRPAHVGAENGYRYYDESQLALLKRIRTLQGYGFSLGEIAGLLGLPDEALARRIHARRLAAYAELNAQREKLRRMESDIIQMEGLDLLGEKYHVTVMDAPAQRVFAIRKTISIAQTHALFAQLYAEAKKYGYRRTGPTQTMYMGNEFDYDRMDVEAQMEVAGDGEGIRVLPAGSFVATVHTGPYEEVKYAYDAIATWLAAHPEWRAVEGGIERYLKDEGMVQSPEELETGVLFRVERT